MLIGKLVGMDASNILKHSILMRLYPFTAQKAGFNTNPVSKTMVNGVTFMNVQELAKHYKTGNLPPHLEQYLPTALRSQLQEMNAEEIESLLNQIMQSPIDLSRQWSQELIEFYYTAAWYHLFVELSIPSHASLYEIAAGDTVCIPRALHAFSSGATYVTANLNKELSHQFMHKTANLDIQVKIIEDNGNNLLQYYEPQSFEVISFHHAINDIIQTIIADIEGIDTVNNNWWDIEPQLLQAVMSYHIYQHYRNLHETVEKRGLSHF